MQKICKASYKWLQDYSETIFNENSFAREPLCLELFVHVLLVMDCGKINSKNELYFWMHGIGRSNYYMLATFKVLKNTYFYICRLRMKLISSNTRFTFLLSVCMSNKASLGFTSIMRFYVLLSFKWVSEPVLRNKFPFPLNVSMKHHYLMFNLRLHIRFNKTCIIRRL